MWQCWRVDVSLAEGQPDPAAAEVAQRLRDFGLAAARRVRCARVFLLEAEEDEAGMRRVARELLADPVVERFAVLARGQMPVVPDGAAAFEVHPRAGVMDPVAESVRLAMAEMGVQVRAVRTARRCVIEPAPAEANRRRIVRLLGNECIEEVVEGGRAAEEMATPARHEFQVRRVELCGLDDAGLGRLAREGHLFLSVEEMLAIQGHFRAAGREPMDLELETLAQTWSEHCGHKTLKSAVVYRGAPMPQGNVETSKRQNVKTADVEIRYENLLRDTIGRATRELMAEGRGPVCLSVFKDNAGVIAFDDEYGIAFKVETHNRPSAIEPYGGAATGVGGVIRDVMGCGLGAKPIANTDVFCVAPPEWPVECVPRGVIHPKTVLRGVVAGVRDYGNRMGIPTVNGAVHFDPRYLGNPLVFCGCLGLIPRDRLEKAARAGDLIVVVGGRTGRDGIHGATFSSAELTDSHADEFSHAVQIGNAIEEKKCLDVILQARDHAGGCLYSAITDCGAGGLSSAVGEMAAQTGAEVDLEKAPLKYAGLRYDEIWISESQERMVLAVPLERMSELEELAKGEGVEATAIGRFTDSGRLVVRYGGEVVGDLDLSFLHEGVPKQVRVAEWRAGGNVKTSKRQNVKTADADLVDELKRRLSSPTIASKEWIVRQYDHEVQGRSVVKPLVGVRQDGPSDAAVIRPRLDSRRGIAIGCGLCPQLSDVDPYWMAVAAIDEAIRNVVCVGGDPARTAILDNFCWGRTDDPRTLGSLVRACQGCYDTAKAYGVPFISGKDSLHNEFVLDAGDVEMVREVMERMTGEAAGGEAPGWPSVGFGGRIAIPGTLLISAVALIDDVATCTTMDFKRVGAPVRWAWESLCPAGLECAARAHGQVHRARQSIASLHDISDGGLLVALAECCIASGMGLFVELDGAADPAGLMFVEGLAGYVWEAAEGSEGADFCRTTAEPRLRITCGARILADVAVAELREVWQTPLRW